MMLFFNQNAGYTIGIDLGVNYAFGILTDLKGNVIEQDEVVITDTDEEIVFAQLKDLTQRLIDKTPACRYGIVGIGIGVPGMINNDGLILFAPNLDWHNVHLKQYMEKYFNVPITIENEAKAGAHGEKIYGAGRSSSNLIYVSLGIGIGSGIIIEDKLYKGTSGISGEIGHFSIESNGRKCRCGNKGCWELYSSELALLEKTAPLFPNEENVNLSFLY
ncbi:ROK family protein [Sinobaca sp. H24]|uniref:ROK family protein n=1 Tax=Sinobaca sp. H24 TaxID=2923376 RepID=UPI002079ACD3|nr:ROK family protein [Sinobaca sp. H24]